VSSTATVRSARARAAAASEIQRLGPAAKAMPNNVPMLWGPATSSHTHYAIAWPRVRKGVRGAREGALRGSAGAGAGVIYAIWMI
jgi:hypothetical protein